MPREVVFGELVGGKGYSSGAGENDRMWRLEDQHLDLEKLSFRFER